jgi:hypothetical protein
VQSTLLYGTICVSLTTVLADKNLARHNETRWGSTSSNEEGNLPESFGRTSIQEFAMTQNETDQEGTEKTTRAIYLEDLEEYLVRGVGEDLLRNRVREPVLAQELDQVPDARIPEFCEWW